MIESPNTTYNCVELCSGAGGQALGLAMAGFHHKALFEIDEKACCTVTENRPEWPVIQHDLFKPYNFEGFRGISLLAGGLPCPPFSKAGLQKGKEDERNLFDIGVNIASTIRPRAVMFENVRGMLDPKFDHYRKFIKRRFSKIGLSADWKLLHAKDFGVAQLRPRAFMIAMSQKDWEYFEWPTRTIEGKTVGEELYDLMSENGWRGAKTWAKKANKVAPTLVGGSKKHGGADLGPSRARSAWAALGVNGKSLANDAPPPDFQEMPRLTLQMTARLQGFPDSWNFVGGKTSSYRQIGNALPPPLAHALGCHIKKAFELSDLVSDVENAAHS